MPKNEQSVGLVVLTGDESENLELRHNLILEIGLYHHRVHMTIEFHRPRATILILRSIYGGEKGTNCMLEDLNSICGSRTLKSPANYKSEYSRKTPAAIFLSGITHIWTPVNLEELDIVLDILGLQKQASAS